MSNNIYNNNRYDWVEKVIHWEICQKFKFDHTNKWFMEDPEFVLVIEVHKVLTDFEIEIDNLISARRQI